MASTILLSFLYWPLLQMWGDISWWCWFASLMISDTWAPFYISVGHCMSSFEQCLIKLFVALFKIRFFCVLFPPYWVVWVPYISWLLPLIRYVVCKYFLPFCRLPFHYVKFHLLCIYIPIYILTCLLLFLMPELLVYIIHVAVTN